MFFDILTSGIGLFKIVRLMIRFIAVYFKYLYGVISLILLTLLCYMIYRGSNVGGFSQFINYFFPTIYSKAFGLFLFLLVIVSILKYIFDPKNERFYEGFGDIYFDLGKRDYADKAYKMSLKHNPNRTYALQRLGDLNTSFSDYDLSIEYYKKSLKINNKLFLTN